MPLTMARIGEVNSIKKVGGKEATRRFLENLGFITGSKIVVISDLNGNLIVNIKDSRIALNREMAKSIII
jgi:ferrous iron transport protein A